MSKLSEFNKRERERIDKASTRQTKKGGMNTEKPEGIADLKVFKWLWHCPLCGDINFTENRDLWDEDFAAKPQRCQHEGCEKIIQVVYPR